LEDIHPFGIASPLIEKLTYEQPVEKFISSRLVKNAQMQGASFVRLRINSPEE
jgi:hypothetical protein